MQLKIQENLYSRLKLIVVAQSELSSQKTILLTAK